MQNWKTRNYIVYRQIKSNLHVQYQNPKNKDERDGQAVVQQNIPCMDHCQLRFSEKHKKLQEI